jgi:N-acetyl-1-D-myo-inositol-2-amino-2-deoxy-alpha-D-glucopyranoside deacetylase
MLFVHAHPDDETINNGATMARYVAEGARVSLLTCTRGEQGEVIPARLAHLSGSGSGLGSGDRLGDHRVGELATAMAALGVTDHRFLGDPHSPGRRAVLAAKNGGTVYRDSGMAYAPDGGVIPSPDPPDGAFAFADLEIAAGQTASLIRELRPQVVVGYEPGGGYGHPDHIQAHLLMMRAVERATLAAVDGRPGWTVPKVYWVVQPESLARATFGMLARAEGANYRGPDPAGTMPSMVVPDDQVSTAIDATSFTPEKIAALRAHETQLSVSPDGGFFALSNGARLPVMGVEFYHLVRGQQSGARDDVGRETDLFAGFP